MIQLLQQRRRYVKSFGERFDRRPIAERWQFCLRDEIGGDLFFEWSVQILRGDRVRRLRLQSRGQSLRRGAGQDLLMLRDYQARDDLRHIDWKATARARRLTVREFAAVLALARSDIASTRIRWCC